MIKNSLIIAHRGESYDAPENTISAFNLAWQRNADAVELDIQLTQDNKVVVIHDRNTKRTAAKNKPVKSQTLSELLKLDAGAFKGQKWKGEKIPLLKDALSTVPAGKKLVIEIKSDTAIIPHLKQILKNSHLKPGQVEIICFQLKIISSVKKLMPDYKALLLSELDYNRLSKLLHRSVDKLINKAVENKLDGLDLWAGELITRELVDKIKAEGLLIYLWTVNNPAKAKKYIDMGIDGITTDRAGWMSKKLSQYFNQ